MQVWNVLRAAGWKYRTQKIAKNSSSAHHRATLSGYIFANKVHIDNQRKFVKQQYLLHMFSQYAELRPTNGWDWLRSLGHSSKFQRVSRLGFVTAPTSLNGGQPNFLWCLAVSWAGTLYIHYWGRLPPNGILSGAKFTCVQVLRSHILAASLHGTRTVSVSQILRRGTRNGITELSLLVIFNRGCHLYSVGWPSGWASAHTLVRNTNTRTRLFLTGWVYVAEEGKEAICRKKQTWWLKVCNRVVDK